MRRPQFSMKTLFWLMAVVAAFFLGIAGGNRRATEVINWERQFYRNRMRQDSAKLAEKEQTIVQLKEHVEPLENRKVHP